VEEISPFLRGKYADENFLRDTTDFFTRKKAGHMFVYACEGEPYQKYGNFLREEFNKASFPNPEAYPTKLEAALIKRAFPSLNDIVVELSKEGPLIATEFGTGNTFSANIKTLPILRHIQKSSPTPIHYEGVELSIESGYQVTELVRENGFTTQRLQYDFNKAYIKPKQDGRRIGIYVGNTVSQMGGFPGQGFPMEEAVSNFKNLRRHFKTGDCLMVGLDMCQDERITRKRYSNPLIDECLKGVLWNIKENLPVTSPFHPNKYRCGDLWEEEHHRYCRTYEVLENYAFFIKDTPVFEEKGLLYSSVNSYRFTEQIFAEVCKQSAWQIVHFEAEHDYYVLLLIAAPETSLLKTHDKRDRFESPPESRYL
jgi:uncharacterized SAM-dependent methyltransferase